MNNCIKCIHSDSDIRNKLKKSNRKKLCTDHEIHNSKKYIHKNTYHNPCNYNGCDQSYIHGYKPNCRECNSYDNYYSRRPRRRHRHKTTHDFTNTHGLVSDHCFCHKYKLTGHFHSRKCCYQDLSTYYSGIIEDESTKICVPNQMCKYYYSYY